MSIRTSATVYGDSGKSKSSVSLEDYARARGLTPGTISIRRFSVPERWIGIRDLPDHYQDVLDHPEEFDEERRRDLLEDIRLWREQGDFVLDWDEDYYFDRDGELASS